MKFQKKLNSSAIFWLEKLRQTLILKDYGKGTLKGYLAEMTLLFKYFNHKNVEQISQQDVEMYMLYIKQVHLVGRAKCRSVAQSCSFFFRKVMLVSYIVPSNLYPKKQFILPNIMSEDEVQKLFLAPLSLKEYCVLGLLYGCGLRISEVAALRIQDIESKERRIKVYQGKGAKDRYTLLPHYLLDKLRQFFIENDRPQVFLFTSNQTKNGIHARSL